MAFTKALRSTTFKLVVPCWLAVLLKFIFAGASIALGDAFSITIPEMSAMEFAGAQAAILAIWLGREWRKSHYAGKD